jgi:1,4-dihydroxy-2-naphthoate octaprenyltransferase
MMLLLAFSIPPHFYFQLNYSLWILLPFVASPLAILHAKKVWTETHKPNLNKVLEQTAQFMALFGLLFSVGVILG